MTAWARAIEERRIVTFAYDGHPREVLPAVYGRNAHTGKVLVRAYQVGGRTKARPLPAWGLFDVAKVVGLRITDRRFHADPPDYRRDDPGLTEIYAQL